MPSGVARSRGAVATSVAPDNLNAWVDSIIDANVSKNFVDRIKRPDLYPVLPLGNGQHATHLMSWGTVDDKNIVYPNVVFEPESRSLRMLQPDEAMDHAIKNNEYLEFKTPEEADTFSKEYKRYWRER